MSLGSMSPIPGTPGGPRGAPPSQPDRVACNFHGGSDRLLVTPAGSLALSPVAASPGPGASLGQPPAYASPLSRLSGGSSPTKDQIIQHRLELEARKAKLEEQLVEIQSKF